MKKNILIIFTGSMELGGIERSLLGLLDSIDYSRYEVDLFLYGHHGPLFSLIRKDITLLPEYTELAYLRESFSQKIKHKAYYSAWRRLVDGIKKQRFDDSWHMVLQHAAPECKKQYDLALSFFLPFDLLREYVEADTKIGWIHTDYSTCHVNIEELRRAYRDLDYIAAVSDGCKNTFDELLPEYREKTIVIENCLSQQFILKQSCACSVEDEMPQDGSIRLLSIGRFCTAKNFDNVPDICRRLLENGLDVKWYLIGFGGDEALIRQKIAETAMQDHVIVLGKKENPYPYLSACDLYVQPSRYEGKSVTVREAQMLGKPVLITRYATSASQLEDGMDGIIVPMDNQGCADGIIRLLRNPQRMKQLSDTCKLRDYSNKDEVEKLYGLM